MDRIWAHYQVHKRFLHFTGGKIALHKCSLNLVKWVWEEGRASIEEYDSKIDNDMSLFPRNSGDNSWTTIKCIGPNQDHKTQGIIARSFGLYGQQITKIKCKNIHLVCANQVQQPE